jgi:ArsR family metal-binding transcriptional regulator
MNCSTFLFGSSKDFEAVKLRLRAEGIEHECFSPSPADASILIWAVSVESQNSSRARELIAASECRFIGHYDLPKPERAFADETASNDSCEEKPGEYLGNIWIAFIAQCFADTNKIRLIAHHEEDTSPLFPYLNAVIKTAQYNPEEPTLSFKKGVRIITLYPHKIAIAKADDLLDAWVCLKEVKDHVDQIRREKDGITPDFKASNPPTALEVYKLLPRSNCARCAKPTCMAFAASLVAGELDLNDCTVLSESRWMEERSQLVELIGE